jgi:hypothetical protein
MAGAGWRQFTVGQLLTSAQVQTFLQDQAVQVFASAAARTSALGTAVSQGMVSYRSDEKALELYAGTAWQPVIRNSNVVINGGMDIWQRSTSASANPGTDAYIGPDRWKIFNGGSGSSATVSQQAFTLGNTIPGYESPFHLRVALSGFTTGNFDITHRVEDVRTFAGQTATLSFWAKADAARTLTMFVEQGYGSGGSSPTYPLFNVSASVTTSWQRFTFTMNVGSISGKTVGANSFLAAIFRLTSNATFDLWGVQLEAGSVATAFARAATTLQGELAACQRYYYRMGGNPNGFEQFGIGFTSAVNTLSRFYVKHPVTMRTNPTSMDFSTLGIYDASTVLAVTSATINLGQTGRDAGWVECTSAASTAFRPQALIANNSASAFLGFSAEL